MPTWSRWGRRCACGAVVCARGGGALWRHSAYGHLAACQPACRAHSRAEALVPVLPPAAHYPQVRKKRYTKLQDEWQALSRKRGRKTDKARLKKAHHRPKH